MSETFDSLTLQTVLIPKDKYTLEEAETWIKQNNYKVSFYGKKVDITENFYRFRQASPRKFIKNSYRTKKLENGVQIVFGKTK